MVESPFPTLKQQFCKVVTPLNNEGVAFQLAQDCSPKQETPCSMFAIAFL